MTSGRMASASMRSRPARSTLRSCRPAPIGSSRGIPLRRLGSTSEVADIIFFLCSGQASYVTGSEIHINGGQHV